MVYQFRDKYCTYTDCVNWLYKQPFIFSKLKYKDQVLMPNRTKPAKTEVKNDEYVILAFWFLIEIFTWQPPIRYMSHKNGILELFKRRKDEIAELLAYTVLLFFKLQFFKLWNYKITYFVLIRS